MGHSMSLQVGRGQFVPCVFCFLRVRGDKASCGFLSAGFKLDASNVELVPKFDQTGRSTPQCNGIAFVQFESPGLPSWRVPPPVCDVASSPTLPRGVLSFPPSGSSPSLPNAHACRYSIFQ